MHSRETGIGIDESSKKEEDSSQDWIDAKESRDTSNEIIRSTLGRTKDPSGWLFKGPLVLVYPRKDSLPSQDPPSPSRASCSTFGSQKDLIQKPSSSSSIPFVWFRWSNSLPPATNW
ncbi:Hypothetical protein NTJ_10072 [Nesidiocoris tenuis]|uniref:Uncharacterized protein n=1 Tax=Nesidiocoris tenuis TaxID=355587 RepID=A0ABN7AYK8_9HEMI|nr:Hypothetical protein NTJ_10072 [Nesidiocoris tenuis]